MIVFVHGKGGNAGEAETYRSVFTDEEILSLDYKSETPWEFKEEAGILLGDRTGFTLIAHSIGVFFFMSSGLASRVKEAFFISPVSDMETVILSMMESANVSESELRKKGNIGELSWEYLSYVRNNPIRWDVPTHAIAGSLDEVMPVSVTRKVFDDLTVLEGSRHWLHTDEEIRAIKEWLKRR